jgi:hypothetical protein
MPHTKRIPEGASIIRDQNKGEAMLKRYERIDGKPIVSLCTEADDALLPILLFPRKKLKSGKLVHPSEWICKGRDENETPMERFKLFYSLKE